MNADIIYPLSPEMWHTYLDWRIVRKGFQGFPFHRTKWRTELLQNVYLSGEECSAHRLCVDLVWTITHAIWFARRSYHTNIVWCDRLLSLGGPVLKLAKIKFAPNAIFRVLSCLYILYDLTYSFLWKNSNHSLNYKVYHCFTVFFTSDWLVTH